ncbi:alpha/beta fold hydrolase [Pendulispora albinea]|uniref:Alpha/beta hydrolase n=1 Tax=Pendulispora albinea TaxID=2741071 RepID=A0ABZ2LVW5_9BACT
MTTIDVPGARLYCETHGSGPLLLLIPGANGDANVFPPLVAQLSARYTVATYDRRGFTRSQLDGPQDYARRLETDADDARRLIEHLGREPATVFGTSSGAIIALQLLVAHPSAVKTVVAFEPAAMHLLPDGQPWIDFFHEVYAIYRRSGVAPALTHFRKRTFAEVDHEVMERATHVSKGPQVAANATYWFERELREYTAVQLDRAALMEHAARIVPAGGQASRGYPTYQAGVELGRIIGREHLELAGGHVGYATHSAEFGRHLLERLATN